MVFKREINSVYSQQHLSTVMLNYLFTTPLCTGISQLTFSHPLAHISFVTLLSCKFIEVDLKQMLLGRRPLATPQLLPLFQDNISINLFPGSLHEWISLLSLCFFKKSPSSCSSCTLLLQLFSCFCVIMFYKPFFHFIHFHFIFFPFAAIH